MDPTSLAGQLAQGKAPTSKSSRPSQHSSKSIVTSKKAKISVARLIACLTMIIIASTRFLKLMSSTKTPSSSLIAKGVTQRDVTLEDYQKPKCQKWSKVSTTMVLRPIWSRKQPLNLNISQDFLLSSKLERTILNFIVKIRRNSRQSHLVWRLRSLYKTASIPRRFPSTLQGIKSPTRINPM